MAQRRSGVSVPRLLCPSPAADALRSLPVNSALADMFKGDPAAYAVAKSRYPNATQPTVSRPFFARFAPFSRRYFVLSGFLAPRRRERAKNGGKRAKFGGETGEKQRWLSGVGGSIEMVSSINMIICPLIGARLAQISLRLPWAVCGVSFSVMVVVAMRFLRETLPESERVPFRWKGSNPLSCECSNGRLAVTVAAGL